MCTMRISGAHRGQKRALDPLELELQMVVNCRVGAAGTKLHSSVRVASALNC